MGVKTDQDERIEVIFSADLIRDRIEGLAREIAGRNMRNLLVISILKGSFIFAADLIRALHGAGLSPQVDFMTLSSYGVGETSSGRVKVARDFDLDVNDRDVLLVDDILESGRTLAFARETIAARGAGRVFSCVLLDKRGHRAAEIEADFVAFDCPDVFVVGYGMDAGYRFRELPFVGRVVKGCD
jgi:hypoxanthine phosphoribosyltransferase